MMIGPDFIMNVRSCPSLSSTLSEVGMEALIHHQLLIPPESGFPGKQIAVKGFVGIKLIIFAEFTINFSWIALPNTKTFLMLSKHGTFFLPPKSPCCFSHPTPLYLQLKQDYFFLVIISRTEPKRLTPLETYLNCAWKM